MMQRGVWRGSEFRAEVVADVGDMFEEIFALDGVDDGDGDGAGEWAAAEGGAVHAGGDGAAAAFGAEHGAHGDAAGDGLGEGGDVGQDAVVLVGEPFAGATHAGLNFVDEKESAGGVAEFTRGGKNPARRGGCRLRPGGLDADGADLRRILRGDRLRR